MSSSPLFSECRCTRRPLSQRSILVPVLLTAACTPEFQVEETTIGEIHAAMEAGRVTAEELVQSYLDRIEAYDKDGPYLNSIITVNEGALDPRARPRRSLCRVRVRWPAARHSDDLKDNYDTYDLPTTNGTLAFRGAIPPEDAFQVRKIREAGDIILAKSNLAEFASSGAFTLSSVLPGFSRNPTTRSGSLPAPVVRRRRPWPPTSGPSDWAQTPGAPSGGRRRIRRWLASGPRWGSRVETASPPSARRETWVARWRARWLTPSSS